MQEARKCTFRLHTCMHTRAAADRVPWDTYCGISRSPHLSLWAVARILVAGGLYVRVAGESELDPL